MAAKKKASKKKASRKKAAKRQINGFGTALRST
jgi:hypothetical protein